jgi:hypothetical protein
MRRVSIADGDYSPPSRPATPGPSNSGHSVSHGSPAPSHVSSVSQGRSRPNPDGNQPVTSAPPSAAAPASSAGSHIPANRYSAMPTPVPQAFSAWRPIAVHPQGGIGTSFAPVINPFAMAAPQPAVLRPVNPPDELGPPPPPPPPPAIPPVVNPLGVHFQPQVPGTEMGPMVHRYVPRQDAIGAPGMFFPGQQVAGCMVSNLAGLYGSFNFAAEWSCPVSSLPITANTRMVEIKLQRTSADVVSRGTAPSCPCRRCPLAWPRPRLR